MSTFQTRFYQLYDEAKDADYRMTKQDFADKINATRNQVNAWLDGRSEPSIKDLLIIARHYHTSVSWLLGETDIRTPSADTPSHLLADLTHNLSPEAMHIIKEFILFVRQRQAKSNQKK